MSILKYIKYYLGFRSIIKTGGKFYVVRGPVFQEALDRDLSYWWYSKDLWIAYCSFNSYEEAQQAVNLYKVKVI